MEGRAIEKFRFHFSILSLSSFPSLKRDCLSLSCKIHAYRVRKKWKIEQSKNFDRSRMDFEKTSNLVQFSIFSLSSFPSLKRDCSSPLCKIHAYTMRKKWKVEQSKNFDRYRFRKKSRSIFNTLSISEKYSSPSCKIHACTIQPRSVRKKWKVEQSKNFDRSRIDFESEAPL